MNNSNESDKLWNILLTNSTLEHNNKNNKQKDKIISAKYYTRNKTMIGCSVKSNGNNMKHTGILAWRKEWNGKWSDDSIETKKNNK